jgi:hypothetical protein
MLFRDIDQGYLSGISTGILIRDIERDIDHGF